MAVYQPLSARCDEHLTRALHGVQRGLWHTRSDRRKVVFTPVLCMHPACHKHECTIDAACRSYDRKDGNEQRKVLAVACRICVPRGSEVWVAGNRKCASVEEAEVYQLLHGIFGTADWLYFYEWRIDTHRSVDILLRHKQKLEAAVAVHVDGRQHNAATDAETDRILKRMHNVYIVRLHVDRKAQWRRMLVFMRAVMHARYRL